MRDLLPVIVPLAAAFAGALLAAALALALRPQGQPTEPLLRAMLERIAVIDAANANLAALGTQVHGLTALLGNKQARGAFGEQQLRELLADRLPADAFAWQHGFADGTRADALIHLPFPPGPIAVDSKFPLEAWRDFRAAAEEPARTAALRRLNADLRRHVDDVATKYIRPGETADGALIFLPSEALHADLHAHCPALITAAARRGVHLVAPGTLWAVLGTLRSLLRDARLREGTELLRRELATLAEETRRLETRVASLRRHFAAAQDDMTGIETAARRIVATHRRIDAGE